MRRLALILFVAVAVSAFAADTTVKGYLVDISCATANAKKPKADFPAKHTKDCLQMPDCEEAGYAVLTSDNKVIKFDKAGNAEAKKFISGVNKKDDIKVAVSGTVKGDHMTVSKIDLQ
jgi:hypothetical protein